MHLFQRWRQILQPQYFLQWMMDSPSDRESLCPYYLYSFGLVSALLFPISLSYIQFGFDSHFTVSADFDVLCTICLCSLQSGNDFISSQMP